MKASLSDAGSSRSRIASASCPSSRSGRLFSVPSRKHLKHYLVLSCCISIWFAFVYGTCDWITSLHDYRLRLTVDWESRIPFYPSAALAYMSIYPLFALIPFVLTSRRDLNRLGAAMALLIGLAGVGFLLLPRIPIPRSSGEGSWVWLFHIADMMNLTYNDLPSLHVGLTVASVSGMSRRTTRIAGVILWCWAGTVAASTLLMHEHYVIDVLAGWCLAVICVRICFAEERGILGLARDWIPKPPA